MSDFPPPSITLDTLDAWQEVAQNLGVDITAHFDRDHTKAEHAEVLRQVAHRLSLLAASMWSAGHRFTDGRWTPPSRYMRYSVPPGSEE